MSAPATATTATATAAKPAPAIPCCCGKPHGDKKALAADDVKGGPVSAAVANAKPLRLSTDAFALKHVTLRPEVSGDAALQQELVATRRQIHAHPELSLLEFETAKLVAARLRAIGHIDVYEKCGVTGVVGVLKGTAPGAAQGPCIALRADMDALPLTEIDSVLNKAYKSQVKGVMHGCGHDGHVASLLGAARVLAGLRDQLCGTVKFLFQPGEEGKAGAKLMVQDGVLEDGKFGPRVDEVYGAHYVNLVDFPVGAVGVRVGPFLASADLFAIELTGKGGHGAMPHATVDTIVAAGHLITQLQTIVARNIHPLDSGVVTVGTVHGGHNDNIIADRVRLTGTMRAYSAATRTLIQTRLQDMLGGLETTFPGVKTSLTWTMEPGYPPTVNASAAHVAKVVRAASAIVSSSYVVDTNPMMGAEDFSFFLQHRPGCYYFLGSNPFEGLSGADLPYAELLTADQKANAAQGLPPSHVLPLVSGSYDAVVSNHRPDFDLDERCLAIGTSVFVQLITDLLGAKKSAAAAAATATTAAAPAAVAK